MKGRLPLIVSIIAVSLGAVGCARTTVTNTSTAIPSAQTTPNVSSAGPGYWKAIGRDSYIIQGRIEGIYRTTSYALKIRIDHVILPGPLHKPTTKFPYVVGDTVRIDFRSPFPTSGPMKPTIGNLVQLSVTEYAAKSHPQPFWGSSEAGYDYEKGGQFYNSKGVVSVIAL